MAMTAGNSAPVPCVPEAAWRAVAQRQACPPSRNTSVIRAVLSGGDAQAQLMGDGTATCTPEQLGRDLALGLEVGREKDVPGRVGGRTRGLLPPQCRLLLGQPG